jgi:hypothetical protein
MRAICLGIALTAFPPGLFLLAIHPFTNYEAEIRTTIHLKYLAQQSNGEHMKPPLLICSGLVVLI